MKTIKVSYYLLLSLFCLTIASCDENEPGPQLIFYGPEVQMGEGTIKSLIELGEKGQPEMIGITFTETAFNGLGHEMQSFVLELPAQAAKTPFDHISFDWAPHGHEPEGIYNLPHFDMHFYMISEAARMQISVDDPLSEKLPAEGFMPSNYVPLPGSVPAMGKHWGDPASPELNGATFTKTFLMGSYNEQVTFYEPMITLDYLKEKKTEIIDLSLPENYQHTGKYYPTKYSIAYDAAKKEYIISLLGLTKRLLYPMILHRE